MLFLFAISPLTDKSGVVGPDIYPVGVAVSILLTSSDEDAGRDSATLSAVVSTEFFSIGVSIFGRSADTVDEGVLIIDPVFS